jgi:L-alanine-DL-glutamate epimerase-like enolase superfamily enzyme
VKITQVAVNVVKVPVDRPYVAGGRTVEANWHVLARIGTSDGVEGIGYVVYPRPDLMTTIGHAARELGEHLMGMSVLEPEAAWDRLARRGDWVGPGGLLHCALAPLDIAVWDAAGKTSTSCIASSAAIAIDSPTLCERRPLVSLSPMSWPHRPNATSRPGSAR